ncbi:hypothetical protein BP5796_01697 [Coleophoma crateriformis]|uniref:Peptide N-acetyl-beta-D-glucosaminyl asparaginase amidase A N-terminal domain-containing protein n=1 Tax=Coleophoma crateriformis TaxID=565419 RepID=A0A3D8T164_9HELO|nr:hypothetical protein BP5796_01697 [Coleophoma crateriformis]
MLAAVLCFVLSAVWGPLHLASATTYENSSSTGLLDVFQVEAPLRSSFGSSVCEQVIVQHEFAASYGTPYVGSYAPPVNCSFTTTIFNMSIVSAGINYDRLGLLFFGDIEIWRSTTAMPVRTGIFYDYQKDMTVFDTLFRSEQKVIMEMDNIYDSVFTGSYNVTITALYYNDGFESFSPADMIIPISTKSSASNASSVISLPDENATISATIPRNAERAVVSILASGNGAEEFWYTNVPTEYAATFNNTAIYGYSPFREVQLLIDGELAGVSWPFPIVFTGGISPGLWVPIVGIDTYDVPSFEIDISPWLGLLCDGAAHTFELKVLGYDTKTLLGTVGSNWWITGSIFIWVDDHGNQTTSTTMQSVTPEPSFNFTPIITTSSNSSTNTSLWVSLTGQRSLSHTSTITTSSGSRALTWSQELSYLNIQNFTSLGHNETLTQLTSGTSQFSPRTSNTSILTNTYSYPITFYQAVTTPADATEANSTLFAILDRSLLSSTTPILAYLTTPTIYTTPAVLATRQNGSCMYYWNDTYYEFAGAIDPAEGTLGMTEQWFSFEGPGTDGSEVEYGRHVKAIDGYEPALIEDEISATTIAVPDTVFLI